MSSVCDIVIPVWNQPELTKRCLESITQYTPEPHRVIVIDNASEEPTRNLLKNYSTLENVTLITNQENLGFAVAVNQGIRASGSEYVCFINNDVAVTEGWLTELIDVANSDTKIGLVNPLCTNSSKVLGDFPKDAARYYFSETAK